VQPGRWRSKKGRRHRAREEVVSASDRDPARPSDAPAPRQPTLQSGMYRWTHLAVARAAEQLEVLVVVEAASSPFSVLPVSFFLNPGNFLKHPEQRSKNVRSHYPPRYSNTCATLSDIMLCIYQPTKCYVFGSRMTRNHSTIRSAQPINFWSQISRIVTSAGSAP
jgi:hypothetical protein